MKIKKSRPVKRIRVSLQDKVAKLLQNNTESHQVTFNFNDGTSIIQTLREEFLKGKKVSMIIADLKAIQHDLNAKYFTI